MVGLELVVGYLAAWAWRKARRVAGQVDADVDEVLDAAMERLHRAVASRLGDDPALQQLEREASTNLEIQSVSARTQTRVQLALEDVIERHPAFAAELEALLAQVQYAGGVRFVTGGAGSVAAGGNVVVSAESGSVAAGLIDGNVSLGTSPPTGSKPGTDSSAKSASPRIDADNSIFAQQGSFAAYRIDKVVVSGAASSGEGSNGPGVHKLKSATGQEYFTDFYVLKTVTELSRLCESHAAVLLFTNKAEPGNGALYTESLFRRDVYPEIHELIAGRDIAISWANLGSVYTNFFTDNASTDSLSVFLKRRRVRFIGCHLFIGNELVGSKRVNANGWPWGRALTYQAATHAFIHDHF